MTDFEGVQQLRGAERILLALESGAEVGLILLRDGTDENGAAEVSARAEAFGVPVRLVTEAVIRRMTSVGEKSEILALVGRRPEESLEQVFARRGAIWLMVGLAYPSNAGMVIRTAEGSGAEGIILDTDWHRSERRLATRTSMHADWYLPVFWNSTEEVMVQARRHEYRVFGIENTGTRAPWQEDLTGPSLFIIGGETHGIPPQLLEQCDALLRLPMAGFIPSYNLQAATSVVAIERLRQLEAKG